MAVNHYNIKRKAHNVSRSSDDQFWNPFRHVSWNRNKNDRADTWAGPGLEEARGHDSNGAPLSHASTAPQSRSPYAEPPISEADDETKAPWGNGKENEKENGNGSIARQPSADGTAGLRNRKPEVEDESPRAEINGPSQNRDGDDDSKNKPKKEGFLRHVEPKKPFTVANQLQRTFLNSWINLLILAAPIGIALNYTGVSKIAVFVVNFIAIIPLAAMLSFATEEIALRTGETLGGLLNATFGNAVELIIAIIALSDNQIEIVQTSLVGSILSNLLLVMGFCFFFGGLRRQEQFFNTTVAQTAASLLALAVASVIVPTVFDYNSNTSQSDVAKLSRGTSVILLLVYAAYLFFQLKTHQEVFNEEGQKVAAKPWSRGPLAKDSGHSLKQGLAMPSAFMGHGIPIQSEHERLSRMLMSPQRLSEEEDEEEDPQLHFFVALATLAASTAIIALCAEYMVNSIDAVTKSSGLSKEFVGLILLPIVGNAAEHATAVTVAIKDKMDLAIGVAVGSSMQVALFLIPLLVIIGWGMGNEDMDLSFDLFQVAVMFVAVLLVNYLIGDGKSHWLEGFLLICLYAIIAVCSFWYPTPKEQDAP